MSDADDGDFYPCFVDDQPASIFLNLRHEHEPPPSSCSTLYTILIRMLDAGEHGMGTAEEAEVLSPVEDALSAAADAKLGMIFVGRLRGSGIWQITMYGPAEQREALEVLVRGLAIADRRCEITARPDAAWRYYRETLLPDAERRQWMEDRRVVETLEDHGDALSIPRRVDHWAAFETPAACQQFVEAVSAHGFVLDSTTESEGVFGAHVYRTDPVALAHIHEVVMTLWEIADDVDGSYDGWETSVERSPS